MKKILLACNMGMSTSLLVSNMQKYAAQENLDLQILALSVSEAETKLHDWDIVMLGPQIRYKLNALQKIAAGKIPVEIINMQDYGSMNGENVVKEALRLIG